MFCGGEVGEVPPAGRGLCPLHPHWGRKAPDPFAGRASKAGRAGLFAVLLAVNCSAFGKRLTLQQPVADFGPTALGGITRIVRFRVPAPDRTDDTVLLLLSGGDPKALPQEVQVIGRSGEIKLRDVEGADCWLQRVAIFQNGDRVRLAVAWKTGLVQSEPAAVQVDKYVLTKGDGESPLMFRDDGFWISPAKACSKADFDRVLDWVGDHWN